MVTLQSGEEKADTSICYHWLVQVVMLVEWTGHSASLAAGLSSLQQAGCLVDCTLAAEGRFLRAHKAVLAAASSYFEVRHTRLIMRSPQCKICTFQ